MYWFCENVWQAFGRETELYGLRLLVVVYGYTDYFVEILGEVDVGFFIGYFVVSFNVFDAVECEINYFL